MDNTPIWESITPDWEVFEHPPPAMGALDPVSDTMETVGVVAGMVGFAAGIYHGIKRSPKSPGWSAIGYGLLGGLVPIVGIPVMLAQGFGKPKRR